MENNDDRMWKKKKDIFILFTAQTVYLLVWFCCMNLLWSDDTDYQAVILNKKRCR